MKAIADVKERFVREIDQALLKRDLYLAVAAMSGRDACDRIARELRFREEMQENAEAVVQMDEQKRLLRKALRQAEKKRA